MLLLRPSQNPYKPWDNKVLCGGAATSGHLTYYFVRLIKDTGPSGRAVYSVGLRPFASWDCGFESRRGHECLSCTLSLFLDVSFSTGLHKSLSLSGNIYRGGEGNNTGRVHVDARQR
jgi:hypothetical protein